MNARLLPARGLYAITPDTADTVLLLARCRALLHCAHPPALLQYRNKCLPKDEQWAQARAVQAVCRAANVPFIVNDSLEMALALDADGLHLGQEDGDLAAARAALGTNRILGATCHDSCQLAQQAAAAGADYLAFGAFFPSPSKPAARRASIDVLRTAHARFAHLPLLLKPDGKGKLSKRDGDRLGFPVFPLLWKDPKTGEVSRGYREDGYFPEAVINFLALLGWNPGTEQEIFSLDELVPLFDISKCSKAGAKFAYDKGIWFNHEYILKKSAEEIASLFFPIVKEHCPEETLERVTAVTAMMKDRVSFVHELWPLCSFFFEAPTEYDEKTAKKRWKEDSAQVMTELVGVLEGIDDFSLENQEQIVHAWVEQKDYKLGNVMNAWRLTLVGEGKGPGMFDISAFLGKEETIARMKRAIAVLG